jgi:hypothetical protein
MAGASTYVARPGLSRPSCVGRGMIHPAFALPEGLDSLRSPVFAFIRLAEQARHAPEMQKEGVSKVIGTPFFYFQF